MQAEQDQFTVELPSPPEPIAEGTDESDWLYDSFREYMHQHAAYVIHKEGGNGQHDPDAYDPAAD
jgi:hypothetical protein